MKSLISIIISLIAALIGLGIMALAGWDDTRLGGYSVLIVCGLLAFGINWVVFIFSALAKTEKFYDLTGSITYFSVIALAVWATPDINLRGLVIAGCVIIWSVRLGAFLFARIRADGEDKRFKDIKTNPARFLVTWTLQGLWVVLTSASALVVITAPSGQSLDGFLIAGLALWLVGFGIEVIADAQKRAFKRDRENAGRFIQSGLWAWSRHPNYFGEIVLWAGIAIAALPVLGGTQWVALISPVFVTLLLTRVSGIPLLEKAADLKWGNDQAYQAYRAATPVLIPKPPRST